MLTDAEVMDDLRRLVGAHKSALPGSNLREVFAADIVALANRVARIELVDPVHTWRLGRPAPEGYYVTEGGRLARAAAPPAPRRPRTDPTEARCRAAGTSLPNPNGDHYTDCPACGRRTGLIGMGRTILARHYRPEALR